MTAVLAIRFFELPAKAAKTINVPHCLPWKKDGEILKDVITHVGGSDEKGPVRGWLLVAAIRSICSRALGLAESR